MSTLQVQTILYNNNKKDLIRSLDSLKKALEISAFYTKAFDIVKVCYGDASQACIFSNKEIELIKLKYEKVFSFVYTYFNCNTGTARGHNLLAQKCDTNYIMVMNPDVLVSPNFFIEIIKPFNNASLNTGLVEARQVPIEHPKEYDTFTGETSWASTASVVFKTDIFRQINGFDEKTFFMYCDDVDLSWRIRLLGKKVIYQPRAMVFHAKRLSSKGQWQATPAEVYYSAEAALLMAYKWSNQNLLSKLISNFKASKDENLRKAVSDFEMRKEKNLLPEQLDKEHKVAQFIGGNYAKHRFSL